jgi:UPF0755 protein
VVSIYKKGEQMSNKSATLKLALKITSFVVRLLLNIIFYILVVILIINVSKMAFEFTYELYGPVTVDKAPGREVIIQIKKGESTMDVASKLELNLAIKNKYSFWLKTKLENMSIMPGTYRINSSMTYKEILSVITDYSSSETQEDDAGTETDKTSSSNGTNTNNDSNANNDKENNSNLENNQ